ncbi:MAG TPA: DUF58 domain-containing protein [Acidimicrobiia bacterium]|nr:DUF58 domain-containing protein [Acidimicrobiia bacterium]
MTVSPTPRLRAYVTAGLVGLGAALAVGDPGPALIGGALLALAMAGMIGRATPTMSVRLDEVPLSMVEGAEHRISMHLATNEKLGPVYIGIGLRDMDITSTEGGRLVEDSTLSIDRIERVARVVVNVSPRGWGRRELGPVTVYADSLLGMFDFLHTSPDSEQIVVLPEESILKRLLRPMETNLHIGELVSTRRGSGSEFADLRVYQPGDDPRSINWRVSSRARSLWVNERHPERNGDIVLLVDAQVESGTDTEFVVDRSVRMAAALLRSHARRQHRLGLVTIDGLCRWIYPGMGESQRRRTMEQLMSVTPGRVLWETAERAVMRVARRPAMVIALTSLLDPHLAGLVHSLRRSGIDVSVIEVDVETVLSPPSDEARSLGRRIWSLERDRLRDRLAAEGIPITVWHSDESADVPMARLEQWRTSWRRRLG